MVYNEMVSVVNDTKSVDVSMLIVSDNSTLELKLIGAAEDVTFESRHPAGNH